MSATEAGYYHYVIDIAVGWRYSFQTEWPFINTVIIIILIIFMYYHAFAVGWRHAFRSEWPLITTIHYLIYYDGFESVSYTDAPAHSGLNTL